MLLTIVELKAMFKASDTSTAINSWRAARSFRIRNGKTTCVPAFKTDLLTSLKDRLLTPRANRLVMLDLVLTKTATSCPRRRNLNSLGVSFPSWIWFMLHGLLRELTGRCLLKAFPFFSSASKKLPPLNND